MLRFSSFKLICVIFYISANQRYDKMCTSRTHHFNIFTVLYHRQTACTRAEERMVVLAGERSLSEMCF